MPIAAATRDPWRQGLRSAATVVVAVLLMGFAAAPTWAGEVEAANVWVVTQAWSPQFCSQAPQFAKEPQCALAQDFVLSRFDKGEVDAPAARCTGATAALPRDVENELSEVFANRRWLRLLWRASGACTGLSPEEYLVRARYFASRHEVPQQYHQSFGEIATSADQIRARFLATNPQIPEAALIVRCSGEWLKAVSYCVADDFSYRACGALPAEERCQSQVRIRGIDPRLKPPTAP